MMSKIIYILVAILFLSTSCGRKNENSIGLKKSNISSVNIDQSLKEKLSCKMIAKDDYQTLKAKYSVNDTLVKITDQQEAQKRLKGIVDWVTLDRADSIVFVKKINFRNGGEVVLFNEEDGGGDYIFTAYYPTEDILMLEGGHSSDMSYDLTTGESITIVGNPDMTSTSPDKKKRVMSFYNGQSSEYFYQIKEGDSYVNKFDLRNYIDDVLGFNIDYIVEGFWDNNDSFYFFIPYYNNDGVFLYYMYYKLSVNLE